MFIAILLTMANIWKQHKCPLIDKQIKMWRIQTYTHTHTHAIKKNKLLPNMTTWMDVGVLC